MGYERISQSTLWDPGDLVYSDAGCLPTSQQKIWFRDCVKSYFAEITDSGYLEDQILRFTESRKPLSSHASGSISIWDAVELFRLGFDPTE